MRNGAFTLWWPLFPLGFVALWILICGAISLSGWHTLATDFRAAAKPPGQSFAMQAAEIGGAQYKGCLSLIVAESGLWMRPYFPFRAFHPPLLVPWSAFSPPRSEKFMFGQRWKTQVTTPEKKRVTIYFWGWIGEVVAKRVAQAQSTAQTATQAAPISPWSGTTT